MCQCVSTVCVFVYVYVCLWCRFVCVSLSVVVYVCIIVYVCMTVYVCLYVRVCMYVYEKGVEVCQFG